MSRSVFQRLALLLAVLLPFASAFAAYPEKPIRFIVPYPPGGAADGFARALGEELSARLKQPVVLENKPGGSLIIGTDAAAKAAPDGYTMLLASVSSLAINAGAFKSLPYDPIKDFAPISLAFYTPFYLIVSPELPVNNLREFIALAKAKPGQLSYASLGRGSSLHLATELLKMMAGIDLVHVPYKGTTSAMPDLMAGRVNMMFDAGAMFGQVQAGKLKLLATTSPQRTPSLPNVPTMSEAGVPGYEVVIWFGLVAPAGTPKAIVERLAHEVAEVEKQPAFKKRFNGTGIEPAASTPASFADLIKKDTVKWTKVLRDAGIPQE
jgi:tripartite-type tricarboxylate transporter receptor subunit TctC